MPVAVEWTLLIACLVAMPVPILAVIMCTNLEPRSLFQKLAANRLLRHWAIVLVVACSALMGAWVWSAVYQKYHVLAGGSMFRTTLRSARVAWLPPQATEVSQMFCDGPDASELVECTISEADFVELAKARGWKIREKNDAHAPARIPEGGSLRAEPAVGSSDVIRRAYFARKRALAGGGYSVWYDRELKRMVYQSTSD